MTIADGTVLKCVASLYMPDAVIAQNVFYVKANLAAPVTDNSILTAIGTYIDNFYTALNADIDSAVVVGDAVVNEWDWDGTSEWETGRYVGQVSLTSTPTGAGDMLPHAVAATITGYCEEPRSRSRKSVPGFVEGSSTVSDWNAATLVRLVAAALIWISAVGLTGSDTLAPVIPTNLGTALPLIATLVSSIIGSQRQRKPGEGI